MREKLGADLRFYIFLDHCLVPDSGKILLKCESREKQLERRRNCVEVRDVTRAVLESTFESSKSGGIRRNARECTLPEIESY